MIIPRFWLDNKGMEEDTEIHVRAGIHNHVYHHNFPKVNFLGYKQKFLVYA